MPEILHFKVNAAIKNIIGKELIHSDSVAIVELIKNSKDAEATHTQIKFIKEQNLQRAQILIQDNGKGMSKDDIVERWLNLAYSEKKDLQKKTYKLYAGNKGVGRFSCDRLGEKLELYTRKMNGPYIKLIIDWTDFENVSINDEMSSIDIKYEELSREKFLISSKLKDFNTGTILYIKKLRDTWPTNKLRHLISELEKFSPSLDDDFSIKIFSDNTDKKISEKLNKNINNSILDKVSFKTTHIKSKISEDGQFINTVLYYQNNEILYYSAKNPYPNLRNLTIEIHYIDTIARAYFKRRTGVSLVDYGSIFLFYNNFRISPYGNARNDWLGLDQRKGQGYARRLGSRELFGRIDIVDHENHFDVLTNREGLANTPAFVQLITSYDDSTDKRQREEYGFVLNIIRELESFVVRGLEWNGFLDLLNPNSKNVISDRDLLKNPKNYKFREISQDKLRAVCERLLKSTWAIQTFKINEDLIRDITTITEAKHKEFLDDFLDKTVSKTFSNLTPHEKGVTKRLIEEAQNKEKIARTEQKQAEEKQLQAEEEIIIKDEELEQTIGENLFLRATSNADTDALLHLMHKITNDVLIIQQDINYYLKKRNKDESLSNEMIDDFLNITAIKSQSILKVAQFATFRNYKMATGFASIDIIKFITDYLELLSIEKVYSRYIKITNKIPSILSSTKKIRPLNLTIMVDNIISNAKKANATSLIINAIQHENHIILSFTDDGEGLALDAEINRIFDKGYTFTNGSGLGLYFVSSFLNDELSATIQAKNLDRGFNLEVSIPCI